jgi:hypothetical protein
MYKRLNNLSFVIGLFFCVVAIILFINAFAAGQANVLNLSTAAVYLVFGLAMILVR